MNTSKLANNKIYGSWRLQKYFIMKSPNSLNKKLFLSVGLLIQKFGWNIKSLRNGLSNNIVGKTKLYQHFKDGEAIMMDFEYLPKNGKNKIRLPNNPTEVYNMLKAETTIQEDCHKDIEFQNLKISLRDSYDNQWPRFLKFYLEKVTYENKRINLAKSHSLIAIILDCLKAKWPTKIIFEAFRQIMVEEIDANHEPIFYTFSYRYFLQKISLCRRKGIAQTLIHEMSGVPREFQVKMTGNIKAYIRLLLRDPRRLLISKIIGRVKQKFGIELSRSAIKTVKKHSLDRNVLEYDANGKESGRQNGLPKISRQIAEAAGEQYQGDWYKTQIFCLKNNVIIRKWAYIVLDVFSLKMVGWSLDQKCLASKAKAAFKMAFSDHGILPEEIIVDNDSVYKRGIFKRFWRRLNNLGVVTTRAYANIPTWKAEVESSFAVFQKLHSDKPWYIGEDIQSKNKHGNPADELRKKLYRDKRNILSESELETEFAKMVQEYNAMINNRGKKITPQDSFRLNPSKRSIKLEDWMVPLLFWRVKTKKRIKNDGRIDLEIDRVNYCYQITKAEILWQHKNTDVRMSYDPKDLSKIHIFERGTLKHIGMIEPRMIMKRDNKAEVLKKQRRILKEAQQYLKDARNADENLVSGITTDRKPLNREKLEDKLLRIKIRRKKLINSVAKIKVDE